MSVPAPPPLFTTTPPFPAPTQSRYTTAITQVTKLELPPSSVAGSTITISLLKDGACPDMLTFLRQFTYALFNKKQTCCPTWNFDALPRPRDG
jgi:hypothetical protein